MEEDYFGWVNGMNDKLLRYAQDFPINGLPGFTNIVSIDSRYVRVSDNALALIGYQSQDQIYGTEYADMPCRAAENGEYFAKEDQLALSNEIKILSFHYFDDWKILLGQKKPIFIEGEVVGTIANFMDITNCGLVNMGRFLLENKAIKKKQFSYLIQNIDNYYGLTEREQMCLFFFIRGYAYSEISKILNIAVSTVQTYIERIKNKFGIINKSQLIEKAINTGFMSVIPESLFK